MKRPDSKQRDHEARRFSRAAKPPFLFGAQYYRAPTPDSSCWAKDLEKMSQIGFNQVKYWVQWRWGHRGSNKFYWDDLDRLMELADKHRIGVTLNMIMDVAPLWLYDRYPDAKQIDIKGLTVEPFSVQHRQIGGHPGPCYNHKAATDERKIFMRAAVEHFRGHPAMHMWDVWNEPEQSYPRRGADISGLTCYCDSCRGQFTKWLEGKYGDIRRLNAIWGRCYERWVQAELPRNETSVVDFVDFREFHLDTMTAEARWRLAVVHEHDPDSIAYLHVVPNTMCYKSAMLFNSVMGVDDFDLAESCDIFAATMNYDPSFTTQVISASRGKVAYNVESHVNFGSLRAHPRILERQALLRDWLPQVGLGVKGFMFWQFRPETLGAESPAWGLVRLDGSDRPATESARFFWETFGPHVDAVMECPAPLGDVGIYKSRKNELFHYCMDGGKLQGLADSVDAYLQHLYWLNYRCRFTSGEMLERGELDGIKFLIMPSALFLTEQEVDQLARWTKAGGVVLCEAHLASTNATLGRQTSETPGMGLAAAWGIRESESTATEHLQLSQAGAFSDPRPPALLAPGSFGTEFVPLRLSSGTISWGGGNRFALLEADGAKSLGSFDGKNPSIVIKKVGKGTVIYCGINLGQGAERDSTGLREILELGLKRAGVRRTLDTKGGETHVHVDLLCKNGQPSFVLISNRSDSEQWITLNLKARLCGLFTGEERMCNGSASISLPGKFVDLFVCKMNDKS